MCHRVRTDLFLDLVWRRIWLGDKSWTNCRSVLGQHLHHDAVSEVVRDARARGGTFSGNTHAIRVHAGLFTAIIARCCVRGGGRERRRRVLVWAVAPRCDHAAPQNNSPSTAVKTSPMNFWKVAPSDSTVDWLEMRHCSEAYRPAHRALVFTDELTSFLGAFFFRERENKIQCRGQTAPIGRRCSSAQTVAVRQTVVVLFTRRCVPLHMLALVRELCFPTLQRVQRVQRIRRQHHANTHLHRSSPTRRVS